MQISEHEKRGIKHHLLDIADVPDEFSAGHFFQAAREATQDILQAIPSPLSLISCISKHISRSTAAKHGLTDDTAHADDRFVVAAEGKSTDCGRWYRLLPALVHLWQAAHARVYA